MPHLSNPPAFLTIELLLPLQAARLPSCPLGQVLDILERHVVGVPADVLSAHLDLITSRPSTYDFPNLLEPTDVCDITSNDHRSPDKFDAVVRFATLTPGQANSPAAGT